LMSQPVVRLLGELGDSPRLKECRSTPLRRGFLGDCLHSIFAILIQRAISVRIRPCATWAINSVELIETSESGDASHNAWLFESKLCCFENGCQASRNMRRWRNPYFVGLDRGAREYRLALTTGWSTSSSGVRRAGFRFARSFFTHAD